MFGSECAPLNAYRPVIRLCVVSYQFGCYWFLQFLKAGFRRPLLLFSLGMSCLLCSRSVCLNLGLKVDLHMCVTLLCRGIRSEQRVALSHCGCGEKRKPRELCSYALKAGVFLMLYHSYFVALLFHGLCPGKGTGEKAEKA